MNQMNEDESSDWARIKKMDKGSSVGTYAQLVAKKDYLQALWAYQTTYNKDAKKTRDELESANRAIVQRKAKIKGMKEAKEDPCWDGYEQIGKKVPNCVKKESLDEAFMSYQDWQAVMSYQDWLAREKAAAKTGTKSAETAMFAKTAEKKAKTTDFKKDAPAKTPGRAAMIPDQKKLDAVRAKLKKESLDEAVMSYQDWQAREKAAAKTGTKSAETAMFAKTAEKKAKTTDFKKDAPAKTPGRAAMIRDQKKLDAVRAKLKKDGIETSIQGIFLTYNSYNKKHEAKIRSALRHAGLNMKVKNFKEVVG